MPLQVNALNLKEIHLNPSAKICGQKNLVSEEFEERRRLPWGCYKRCLPQKMVSLPFFVAGTLEVACWALGEWQDIEGWGLGVEL